MTQASTSWFACYTPRPDARLRVIGFPHGGGGPQAFREWGKRLPDDVELIALSLPGRGSRLADPLITDMAELVSCVADALPEYFDKPFAFFGHSVGAIVAYEVTRELQQRQYPLPQRLFVSAHKAPHVAAESVPMYNLPDAQLITMLRDLGLVPEEALDDEGLLELILPPLKADFELSETYRCDVPSPLSVPVTAMGGKADPLVTTADLQDWASYTAAAFDMKVFDGDHFYTQSHQADVTQTIVDTLLADVAALPPSILHGEAAPYPDKCLHQLFREQAAKTPGATAVVGDDISLTFEELDAQTDLLAGYLQQQGVGVDALVGIYMETSVAFVVSYLAALKAGGAYMPIEVAYPDALLNRVLDTAQPVVVLTNNKFYERLPASWRAQSLRLDSGWVERLQAMASEVSEDRPQPTLDSLAYCVMSSGTTGTPKGMICPHRGAVNSYYWRYVNHPYEAGEREACNVFFVWEVIRPLLQGHPTYVIPDDVIYDPPRLVAFLSEHRITRVLFTPSLLEQVLNTPNLDLQAKLSHLRVVYLNGEVVTTTLRNRFRELFPQVTLLNDYSISECHDVCTYDLAELNAALSPKYAPLGAPMTNVYIYLLDEELQPVPMGFRGEIYVGGDSVARGYLNEPERTAERFIEDPIRKDGSRLFRTGDAGRLLPNGHLEIQGRVAFMVKLRGYSIVPGAVETTIAEHPAVNVAVVTTLDNEETGQPEHLVAYVVGTGEVDDETLVEQLRPYLKDHLPHYAVPSYIMPLTDLPLTAIGKLDRDQLPKPDPDAMRSRRDLSAAPPETQLEQSIAKVWQDLLHTDMIDTADNFFDLGGHSLMAAELCTRLRAALDLQVSVVDIFQYPTVRALAHALQAQVEVQPVRLDIHTPTRPFNDTSIAIVGMACRFPGADGPNQFWHNLQEGLCSIRTFSDKELEARGVPPEVYNHPDYVRAGATLDDVDQFDPAFWGISRREAMLMDPQHRLFLECCWHALEHAGYAPMQDGGRTGVFAGSFLPLYLLHVLHGGGLMDPTNPAMAHLTEIGNDKDYVATRVSHLLNLRGPSVSVQTSCSTGLVAIATACQALLAGQCDTALAGASSITFPQAGYLYVDGFINSRDGQCRAFDAEASGTILGDGVGVVTLKRLEDAKAAGDHILGVIKGFAVNNDGNLKADYSAPSVQGQAEVIATAQAMAGVAPETISYIEAHGTGTLVGDPIEVRALTTAFQQSIQETGFCAIGSVKPNIGHSNITAGVAGLIKVILCLQHRQLPPTINFKIPNPAMQLESTPFFVNDQLRDWEPHNGTPRRAGITCLGIGGTNCHMVVEEWPGNAVKDKVIEPDGDSLHHLLTLSAKTPGALEQNRQRLIETLETHPDINLHDAAYTLHVGRETFSHRLAVAGQDVPSIIAQLNKWRADRDPSAPTSGRTRSVVMMFSGQGSQYLGMGAGLYREFPVFRQAVDTCSEILKPLIGANLNSLLYADTEQTEVLERAYLLQPALFTVEYALAQTLMNWGIRPTAVVGHSLGEYAAACIAGVVNLEDALSLVASRGLAMEDAGEGAMLAVSMSEDEVKKFLAGRGATSLSNGSEGPDVGIATINAPGRIVLSGSCQAVERAESELKEAGVACQRVHVARAFHSPMMTKAAEAVTAQAKSITLHSPAIPLASNLTGDWLTDQEALDPAYWGHHMLQAVRFEDNVRLLLQQQPDILFEVGPGRILSSLAMETGRHMPDLTLPPIVPSMRHPRETQTTDPQFLLQALARAWEAGINIDWEPFHAGQPTKRIALPGYAFEKERCWPDASTSLGLAPQTAANGQRSQPAGLHPLIGQRLYSATLKPREYQFEVQLQADAPAYLQHHQIYGKTVFPGTAYIEMALAAGAQVMPGRLAIETIVNHQALALAAQTHTTVQILLNPDEADGYTFKVLSLTIDDSEEPFWTLHASGHINPATESMSSVDVAALQATFQHAIPVDTFYQYCRDAQADYGPNFQLIEQLWKHGSEGLGRILVTGMLAAEMETYQLHPALLEAGQQVVRALGEEAGYTDPMVPVGWDRVLAFKRPSGNQVWAHVKTRSIEDSEWIADIDFIDEDGQVIATLAGAREQRTSRLAFLAEAPWQDWLYKAVWQPQVLRAPGEATSVTKHWLILADADGVGEQLAAELQTRGDACTIIFAGESFAVHHEHAFSVSHRTEDIQRVLEAIPNVDDVVNLWPMSIWQDDASASGLEAMALDACSGTFQIIQALEAAYSDRKSPALWLTTRGAQVVSGKGVNENPQMAQAALWGMGRVIPLEHPDLHCAMVDIDPEATEHDVVQALYTELIQPEVGDAMRENLIAFRHGVRYVARIARHQQRPLGDIAFRKDATYMITGGMGGLGLRVATWMVDRGARHLVLVGRSPAKPEAQEVLQELEQRGAHVTVAQADISVDTEVIRLMAGIDASQPLRGVIHAAGVLDDGIILQQSRERFARVLAPKVKGAWHLHHLTQDLPLDFFVLFSSDAALLGSGGQANHAAANAMLDALAFYRQAQGLPTTSISWGGWAEIGTAAQPLIIDRIQSQGMDLLAPEDGLQILESSLLTKTVYVNATPIYWDQFRTYIQSPFWSDMRPSNNLSATQDTISHQPQLENPEDRQAFLQALVCEHIANVLGLTPSEVGADIHQALFDLGMDSLSSLELRNSLQTSLNCQLPTTFIFQYPTVEALVEYLANDVLSNNNAAATEAKGD